MRCFYASKFKMIGMQLNFVHGQVQKSQQKHITKKSNGFHIHSTLMIYAHTFNLQVPKHSMR